MRCQIVARWLEFPAALLREAHLILTIFDLLTFGRPESEIQHFQHVAIAPHLGYHVCKDMVNSDMKNSLEPVVEFGPGQQMKALHALSVHFGFHSVALSELACHAP